MQFTTSYFIFFFLPLGVILYYLLNLFKKDWLTNIFLIFISILFYASTSVDNVIYLLVFITIIYFIGKILEAIPKKVTLALFIIILILILSYYKYGQMIYLDFNNINLVELTFSDIIIPLGLSFIMFESISYLVDIYKKEARSGSYIDTLLFFLFFPKVASGPIVLWKDFYPQVKNRQISVDLFFSGMERIMIGFAKKSIIADSLGLIQTRFGNF